MNELLVTLAKNLIFCLRLTILATNFSFIIYHISYDFAYTFCILFDCELRVMATYDLLVISYMT